MNLINTLVDRLSKDKPLALFNVRLSWWRSICVTASDISWQPIYRWSGIQDTSVPCSQNIAETELKVMMWIGSFCGFFSGILEYLEKYCLLRNPDNNYATIKPANIDGVNAWLKSISYVSSSVDILQYCSAQYWSRFLNCTILLATISLYVLNLLHVYNLHGSYWRTLRLKGT